MAGLLDTGWTATNPTGWGLLAPQGGGGLLGGFNTAIGANPMALTALGLGILSGQGNADSFGQGMKGLLSGATVDAATSKTRKAEEEKAAQRRALASVLSKLPGITADMAAFGEADPEAGRSMVVEAMKRAAGGGGMFQGNSVDAQSLNFLVRTGKLTPDQAASLGAGKSITGPNGEIIFATPEGIFSRPQSQDAGQPNPGMIPLTQGKPTDSQSAAATYANRMNESDKIITANEKAGTSLVDRGLSQVPVAGNYVVSQSYQLLDQAKRDFVNAVLRRESGAVISPSEFANAEKQYFPQPGDTDAVIEQKRANRQSAIQGIAAAAGPAMPKQTEKPQSGVVDYRDYFGGR